MNANEITFGIEIECTVPHDALHRNNVRVGGYHSGAPIPGFPAGWNCQSDSSIDRQSGFAAVEIVSGVLKGRDGIQQVIDVVAKLNSWGARINPSCGLHVHIGAGFGKPENFGAFVKFLSLVAKFELAIFAVTGTKSREHGNWCRPISQAYEAIKNARNLSEAPIGHNRYHSVNLQHIHSRGTVEFRAFQGTLNINKILGYVQLCIGLAEKAYTVKRRCNWKAIMGDRTPTGLVRRMMSTLNWTGGTKNAAFGKLVDDTAMKAVRREFRRLATKYEADGRTSHNVL